MIDSPTSSNVNDFKQRYQNVIGWYIDNESGKKILVRVHAVGPERVTFVDQAQHTYYAVVDGGVKFEFLPVEKAWRNTADQSYYVHRIPARQYRRGISEENTICSSLGFMETAYGDDLNWTKRIFSAYSYPQEYKKEVDRFLADKRPNGVAISPHFAIGKRQVFFNNLVIGSYSTTAKDIKLSEVGLIVEQELRDCIRRNNYPFIVRT